MDNKQRKIVVKKKSAVVTAQASASAAKGSESGSRSSNGKDETKSADWIAEASHELRLPIANLKLLIETLLDGALEDEETAKRMLGRAQKEVDRLQHLVVNLLSVEKVSNSSLEVSKTQVDLGERAVYVLDSIRKQANEKKIQVELDVPPRFFIHANSEQLDQVLLNLVENAIKFTPDGGKVKIGVGGSANSFYVQDSGIGIAAHEIPKIFKRFYRVDRAKSRGSTGLGLSIVKHIADLHGAKIIVTSAVGQGSTFRLDFPARNMSRSSAK